MGHRSIPAMTTGDQHTVVRKGSDESVLTAFIQPVERVPLDELKVDEVRLNPC